MSIQAALCYYVVLCCKCLGVLIIEMYWLATGCTHWYAGHREYNGAPTHGAIWTLCLWLRQWRCRQPSNCFSFCFYLCPLSFWLTLPWIVLSTYWCCPSRPCMVFLAYVHLALFFALSLFPGNSIVSSWCDHSMLASLLWQCLTVSSLLQLC